MKTIENITLLLDRIVVLTNDGLELLFCSHALLVNGTAPSHAFPVSAFSHRTELNSTCNPDPTPGYIPISRPIELHSTHALMGM